MSSAPHPANEVARLRVLRALNVLDTPAEERFDRITRIAQRVFEVPIALVSLVDTDRQWFKSCQGLDIQETSRSISFCAHTILKAEPLIITDTLQDPRFQDNPLVTQAPNIRFYAGVPLTVLNGIRLGTLCVLDQTPRAFGARDQRILQDLAAIVEQEILSNQVTLANELKRRNDELKLLSKVSYFLQAALTLEEAYAAVVSLIEFLFPGCSGSIFLASKSGNRVERGVAWGEAFRSVAEFHPNECWGLRRGNSHWVEPPLLGLRCRHISAIAPTVTTLCVPMMAQGQTLGLFFLSAETPEALSDNKQQLAITVAEQVALAITNLNLRRTLKDQSIRDPLTGLFNRRYLEETLTREIARARRNQLTIGIVMADVDHFKHFNDTYGHEAGDQILETLGQLLIDNVRGSDTVCRYGGEELTLVLPESSLQETCAKAEEIRLMISEFSFKSQGQTISDLTVSFGVASFPEHGSTSSALIQAADAALYRAKTQGRNRVVVAP